MWHPVCDELWFIYIIYMLENGVIHQQSFIFAAWFNFFKDLMPKPPCSVGLHIFFQATVTSFLFAILPLHMKFLIAASKPLIKDTCQSQIVIEWINMLWIMDFTNWTLPAIDNREAFQNDIFDFILYTMGWRWQTLGFPLKIGTPKYVKGNVPILKPMRLTMCFPF